MSDRQETDMERARALGHEVVGFDDEFGVWVQIGMACLPLMDWEARNVNALPG